MRVAAGAAICFLLIACGENTGDERPEQKSPPAEAPAGPPLPESGPEALSPLIGKWATRPEYCVTRRAEAGAAIEIGADGLRSAQIECAFKKVARTGPRYDIIGNCSTGASGPVPDETLIFVFTAPDRVEWRAPDGAVQLSYLRCPPA